MFQRLLPMILLLMLATISSAQQKFLWGTASASYQVEGAYQSDGKGLSNWDVYTNQYQVVKAMTGTNQTGNTAINAYDRKQYLQDIQLMKSLGVNAYRFSIAWARLLPNGTGKINQKGIAHYQLFIDDLLAAGIQPCITLYHWDLPQTLQAKGGWNNPQSIKWYEEYSNLVFKSFGKKVKFFITFNEPYIDLMLITPAVNNIKAGRNPFANTSTDIAKQVTAAHHLLLANATAINNGHKLVPGAKFGITLSLSPTIPADENNREDVAAAELQDGLHNRWFLDALFKGTYPQDVLPVYQKLNSSLKPTAAEMALLKSTKPDFLGINFYAPNYVKKDEHFPFGVNWMTTNPDSVKMFNGPVRPAYLYKMLMRLKTDYGNPLMYITENGAGFGEKDEQVVNGEINDALRTNYVQRHIDTALAAKKDGANLQGYFLWSIFDNFEWISGYKSRFGIVHVNFETQQRTPKRSYYEYQKIIAVKTSNSTANMGSNSIKQIYDLKELFNDVQTQKVLPDGKTFPDCIPKSPLSEIAQNYTAEKSQPGFNLKMFVTNNFNLPPVYDNGYKSDTSRPIEEHIRELWTVLTRKPDQGSSSLINLPHPYIVPGGRFREIYYWDSYFTMLGLKEHGQVSMIENMINNFDYLIKNYGHIPNGNRTYYSSRSQPPFFAMMVELLATAKGDNKVYATYLNALQKEYNFWQASSPSATAFQHTVKLGDGQMLNRYFDQSITPRAESYAEDVTESKRSNQPPEQLYSNIRAAAESGWDFSSRWFADSKNLSTIQTTNIIPVDLNCLLYKLELVLAKAYAQAGNETKSIALQASASKRLAAIIQYCWSNELGFFTDYDWVTKKQTGRITAAGLMPLFTIGTGNQFIQQHINEIESVVKAQLLKLGGIVTTPNTTGQQWDAPNGWAPLQWIAVKGFANYGKKDIATTIAKQWTMLNEKVYKATGKMMEKYDVQDISKLAGGGEYKSQDGFGWSNGVYLAMKAYLKGE